MDWVSFFMRYTILRVPFSGCKIKQHFQIRNDDTFRRLFAIAQSDGLIVRRQVSEREVYYSLATPQIDDEPELFW